MATVLFRRFLEYSVVRTTGPALRCLTLLLPLAGCAEANETIARMDDFFFSLEGEPAAARQPVVVQPPITRHPGYAPAYPPYQASLGQWER
jgi:hypothetical protein